MLLNSVQIYEVIIVDNNSNDGSVEYLQKHYPNIRIIKNDGNYGYAKGYNLALQKIDTEYFILLNSDIQVTKDWIDPIIDLMDKDQSISACQPKYLIITIKKSLNTQEEVWRIYR